MKIQTICAVLLAASISGCTSLSGADQTLAMVEVREECGTIPPWPLLKSGGEVTRLAYRSCKQEIIEHHQKSNVSG